MPFNEAWKRQKCSLSLATDKSASDQVLWELWNHSCKKSSCLLPNFQKTINHKPWTTQRMYSLYMLLGVRGCWPLSFKINHWISYDINMISFIHQLSCLCDSHLGISQFAPFGFMLEELKQHETTYVHSQHLQPQPIHSPFASKAFKSIGSASSYCLRCFFALLIGANTGALVLLW